MKAIWPLPELDRVWWVVVANEASKAQLGVEVDSEEVEVVEAEVEVEVEVEVVGAKSVEDVGKGPPKRTTSAY